MTNIQLETQCEALGAWLEKNAAYVPNIQKLINKIRNNKSDGHLVHGNIVKRLVEDGTFAITDVEREGTGFDVDIELDGSVNIQVWNGASIATYNIIQQKGISEFGGVPTDWQEDERKIMKKLGQLPNNSPGILLCYPVHIGIHVLPEWLDNFPENKVLVEMFHTQYSEGLANEATLWHSPSFKYRSLTIAVLNALRFGVKQNPFCTYSLGLEREPIRQ